MMFASKLEWFYALELARVKEEGACNSIAPLKSNQY
jgi:hypothetical protein